MAILDGDETGQKLLEQGLRMLGSDVAHAGQRRCGPLSWKSSPSTSLRSTVEAATITSEARTTSTHPTAWLQASLQRVAREPAWPLEFAVRHPANTRSVRAII